MRAFLVMALGGGEPLTVVFEDGWCTLQPRSGDEEGNATSYIRPQPAFRTSSDGPRAITVTRKLIISIQISDVISMFFLVSQSLRTGEPLHQAQYKNLVDRLHYHSGFAYSSDAAADHPAHTKSKAALRQVVGSYDYMFYATAVVAVLQMAHVSLPTSCPDPRHLDRLSLPPSDRVGPLLTVLPLHRV